MIKVIVLLKRHPSLTREEFQRHWRDIHGPLVMTVPELTRHMRKYVQNHIVPDDGSAARKKITLKRPAGAMDFDGIVEIWYDTFEDMPASFKSQHFRDVIRPDELRFLDDKQSVIYVTEELVVFDEVNRPSAESQSV